MERPVVRRVGRNKWRLHYNFTAGGVTVPKGFVTDGASVPRFLWAVFSPAGVLFEAAIVHDYLYVTKTGTKEDADTLFYSLAIRYGANKFTAYFAYLATKYFGTF